MGSQTQGRIANPSEFPDVVFGMGVIIHGRVKIKPGAYIGDYSILGIPAVDELHECAEDAITQIGVETRMGSYCVIHRGAQIGDGVWLDDRSIIGPDSRIGDSTRVLYSAQIHWRVTIGTKCVIGGFCCDRASIGDNCIMLGKLIHRLESPWAPWDEVEEPSPLLEDHVVVGFDALVIGGVSIHANSYIAAGAIVTKDIIAGSRMVGSSPYKGNYRTKTKRKRHG